MLQTRQTMKSVVYVVDKCGQVVVSRHNLDSFNEIIDSVDSRKNEVVTIAIVGLGTEMAVKIT